MTSPSVDDWRRWIAENLLLEASPNVLCAHLVEQGGFTANDAVREVEGAINSPYLMGAHRMRNRMIKRDWTLSVLSDLARLREDSGEVPRRDRLSAERFFEDHYYVNRPVVISGMFEDWPARTKWNLDYFRENFGDRKVEVQLGRDSDPEFEINRQAHTKNMLFGEYVDMVANAGSTNDFYITANNTGSNKQALAELWDDITPIAEYLDGSSPDSGFFWLGPAGTKTPFHHDLTNNFMAQVIGRKRVKLVPMTDTIHMYNHTHCYTTVDGFDIDYAAHPDVANTQIIECEIGPGDLLFIPIGWWHCVEGLDVSVTMSFINFHEKNDFSATYRAYHDL
ncbi:cupin-like domain-containing protein [Actinocorallia longicatena]|uniref:Cupin-like domain-containing protein n=1 Tax=Actinocorallia longicatena TaxID=111803 RepID=A0ABP6Q835_9ACTN